MEAIGEKIKVLREHLGRSQASVAEAVGTTQQTVDRIERGAVSHSRYALPMLEWLEAIGSGQPDRDGGWRRTMAKVSNPVPTLILDTRGIAADGEPVEAPPFLQESRGGYSVLLSSGVRGPAGDVLLRAGDRLFVDPLANPRHFDTCFATRTDGNGAGMVRVALDPDEVPQGVSNQFEGFAILGDETLILHKVVAIYTR